MERYTEKDIIVFWTITTTDVSKLKRFFTINFEHYYFSIMRKIYFFENMEQKYYVQFHTRLEELMTMNKTTFIENFDPEDGKTIQCMDGLLTYEIDDNVLVIPVVQVLHKRQRQGIFSNFLYYVAKFPEFDEIVITDISESMESLLRKITIDDKNFIFVEENDSLIAKWIR